jgi:hypothetical protein
MVRILICLPVEGGTSTKVLKQDGIEQALCNYVGESVSQPLRPRVLVCYRPVAHIETLDLGRIKTRICNEPLPPIDNRRRERVSLCPSLPFSPSLSLFSSISVWLSVFLSFPVFLLFFLSLSFPLLHHGSHLRSCWLVALKPTPNGRWSPGCWMSDVTTGIIQKKTRPVVDLTKSQSRGRSNEIVGRREIHGVIVKYKTSGIKSSCSSRSLRIRDVSLL